MMARQLGWSPHFDTETRGQESKEFSEKVLVRTEWGTTQVENEVKQIGKDEMPSH